jgi:hypothetical protein
LQPTCNQLATVVKDANVPCKDTIYRQVAIDALVKAIREDPYYDSNEAINGLGVCDVRVILNDLPSAQPHPCEGCKHLGKWENEVEYGYPSPCSRCKRRAEDHYER